MTEAAQTACTFCPGYIMIQLMLPFMKCFNINSLAMSKLSQQA